MKNNEALKFKTALARFKTLHAKAPRIMGTVAVKLFKESFTRQGSIMGGGQVQPWQRRGAGPKNRSGRKLLVKTGALQRSLQFTTTGSTTIITSNLPYSQLQNDGGVIKITPKMRRFFWAMYLKSGGSMGKGKDGKLTTSGGDVFWARMALHKGNTITIPGRPFVYDTPEMVTRLNATFKPQIEKIFA